MARKVIEKKKEPKTKSRTKNPLQISTVAPWFFAENWNHLIVNSDFIRMGVISNWRNKLPLNWGDWFRTFKDRTPVSFVFVRRPGSEIKQHLALTMNMNKWEASHVNESIIDRRKRQFESEQAANATDLIIQANAKVYETYAYTQIRTRNFDQLDIAAQTCEEHISSKQLDISFEPMNQAAMFWAASPFLLDDNLSQERYNASMPATTIARGLINRDNGFCDPVGIPLGFDRDNKGKVIVDFLTRTPDRPNSNISIIAESGQGKSFLMKKLIVYLRALYDCTIIINDVDGEYGWLCKEMHGYDLGGDGSTAFLISPFAPRNTLATAIDAQDGELEEDEEIRRAHIEALKVRVLASHIPFLVKFLIKNFGLDKSYEDILTIACTWAYEYKGITSDMTFGEYNEGNYDYPGLIDIYQQLPNVPKYYPGTQPLVDKISRAFFKGIYGAEAHLWSKESTQVPDDAPLIRINLQGLSNNDEQLSAQYYNILSWEWSQLRSKRFSKKMTFIITDEMHVLCKDHEAIFMLRDIAQRIRKYGGGLISSTQHITDLMIPSIKAAGEGIVNSSTYRFFSRAEGDTNGREPTNASWVKSLLRATDDTMEELAKAPQGEFILCAGSQREWVDIYKEPWLEQYEGKAGGK